MRKWLSSLLVVLALVFVSHRVHAQPSLKMMIPANPGGGWDQTGRNLANATQSVKLVSSVQFENKGGAGGTIGLAPFNNSAKGDPTVFIIHPISATILALLFLLLIVPLIVRLVRRS